MATTHKPTTSGKTSRSSLESVEEKQAHTPSDALSHDGQNDEEDQLPERVQTRGTMRDPIEGGAPLEVVMSYQSIAATPSIPNGGLWAWLQVLAGFFMFFNSWYVCSSDISSIEVLMPLLGVYSMPSVYSRATTHRRSSQAPRTARWHGSDQSKPS